MLHTADEVALVLKARTMLVDVFVADYSTEWVYSQKQQQ